MNIQRFHAATAREALAKARMAFGEGTLILSNRPTATGVEVLATGEDALNALDESTAALTELEHEATSAYATTPLVSHAATAAQAARDLVQEDTENLAMSTLSFQDYVRERMLRRRHEELHGGAQPTDTAAAAAAAPVARQARPAHGAMDFAAAPQPQTPAPTQNAAQASVPAPAPVTRFNPLRPALADTPAALHLQAHALAQPAYDLPVAPKASAPFAAAALQRDSMAPLQQRPAASGIPAATTPQQGLMNELQSVKALIEDRFNTLSWLGQARQNPIQSNLMLKLIRAGYSPTLARTVLERMPESLDAGESVRWLMDVLERNLKTSATPLYEEGGIYALVGSTGVGKTTTTAKLAALCARAHGPGSVGLITLDTYRVGAHEQLRSYGRMLGIVAHLAHDQAALQDLLGLLGGKKMVLIDTTGVAPRDPRKRDMLEVLNLPHVRRLVVLNASSHGDTLDDTLSAFKTEGEQQAILSKVDEAVKLGPAIDALVRHHMVLRGVTNGQRVPEDWEEADAHKLVGSSMHAQARSAFDPVASDLNFFFTQSASSETHQERGLLHA